eukprot:821732-Prymnesium_polylepis.1
MRCGGTAGIQLPRPVAIQWLNRNCMCSNYMLKWYALRILRTPHRIHAHRAAWRFEHVQSGGVSDLSRRELYNTTGRAFRPEASS